MKKIFVVVVLLSFASSMFGAPNLYVSHEKLKKITVIDTAVNEILGEIPLKMSVVDIKLDPEEKYLYYISADTNALYRIRCKNLTPDADFVNVGYGPTGLAVRNDNKAVYVINGKSENITMVDTTTFEAAEPIKLPGSPRTIVITDDDRKAYIGLSDMGGVALLDLNTNKITGVIPVSTDPWGMCTYNNKLLFVSNEGMASVSVIDIKKNSVINEMVTTDQPRGVAAYNNMLYVAVMNGLDIFELKGFTKPSSLGLDYPVYDCDFGKTGAGTKIFVAGYENGAESGKVAVIEPASGDTIAEVEVMGAPKYLEIKKIRPTPMPTATPTKTYTPVPAATATPTETFTRVPKKIPTATTVPTKKPTRRPTPKPAATSTPDMRLRADISGRVYMDNVPVVAGIKIKALSKHTDKVYTASTDGDGRYKFSALPIGAYVLSVDATYILEKAVPVTVNRGKNPDVDINTKKRK